MRGFWELSAARGGTGYGPLPIRHSEIEAWARLNGGADVWETRLIRELDQVWMEHASRVIEQRSKGGPEGAPTREMTVDDLMAMAGGKRK